MKGYQINTELYIFPQEAGVLEIGEDVTKIYIQYEQLNAFKALNTDIANLMVGYNYNIMTVLPKVWENHTNDDYTPGGETNSIAGTDFDDNEGAYGTVTVSLENETPMTATYVEDDLYSDYELMNVLYNDAAKFTDSSVYEWTKDGEPIEGVETTGGDTEPHVYTYYNNGEDAPMFTVEYDGEGDVFTLTPDATGVFVATAVTEPVFETLNITQAQDYTLSASVQTDTDWTGKELYASAYAEDSNALFTLKLKPDTTDPTLLVLDTDYDGNIADETYLDETPIGICDIYVAVTEETYENVDYSWTNEVVVP